MADPVDQAAARLLKRLTEREKEVLALIAEGLSVAEIARRLHRSTKTIESHRLSLGRKLGVDNRVKLARLAIQADLASVPGTNEQPATGRTEGASAASSTPDETEASQPSEPTPTPAPPSAGGLPAKLAELMGPFQCQVAEIIENCSDALSLLDRENTIVMANTALCRLLGQPRQRVLGRRCSDFVIPGQRTWYHQVLHQRAQRRVSVASPTLIGPEGWAIQVQVAAESLFDCHRQYLGAFSRLRELNRWPAAEHGSDEGPAPPQRG
jgi:PAS domain S-box-containing protein